MVDTGSYVRDEGGRGVADMEAMEQARASGTCPFCEIITGNKPDQPVLLETAHWVVFKNIRPENYSELHLVAAAKIPSGHSPTCSFDDIDSDIIANLGPAIQAIRKRFDIDRGRSVFMRIGEDGDHNAQTVFHPHFHTVVSDGKPIKVEDVTLSIRSLLEWNRPKLLEVFRVNEPELYRKAEAKGSDKLWSEALKYVWENIALLRSALDGKAGEIRPKFSNKAISA